MEKYFVPYEEALALKELGFDEECIGYSKDKEFKMWYSYDPYKNSELKQWFVAHPLYQQAFDWFRENHKLESTQIPVYDKWYNPDKICGFATEVYNSENGEFEFISNTGTCQPYQSYEDTRLKNLQKLIEIVKQREL